MEAFLCPISSHIIHVTWTVHKLLQFTLYTSISKQKPFNCLFCPLWDQGTCWFLYCLLISLRTTSELGSSSAVIVLSSNGLPATAPLR